MANSGYCGPTNRLAEDSSSGEGEHNEDEQDNAHATSVLQRGQGQSTCVPTVGGNATVAFRIRRPLERGQSTRMSSSGSTYVLIAGGFAMSGILGNV